MKTIHKLLALALCLDPLQPINKKLWTPAFVFAAGAYSLGMFALFYPVISGAPCSQELVNFLNSLGPWNLY